MLERSLKSLGIVPEPNLIAVGFKDKYFMTPGINFWPFEKPALVCRYRLVCHNKESISQTMESLVHLRRHQILNVLVNNDAYHIQFYFKDIFHIDYIK